MYKRQLQSTIFRSFQRKCAFSSVNLPPSLMNLWSSRKRISSGSNHLPLSVGESIKRKKHEIPRATVTIPSKRKIQRQPSYPPTPSMFAIAAAKMPEKAPERADAQ
jgi:hypothetical protein